MAGLSTWLSYIFLLNNPIPRRPGALFPQMSTALNRRKLTQINKDVCIYIYI